MFYQTVSIDLVEYQYSSVVKVSGLWTADHEFKSTSGFCSYLLQLKLNVLTIIVYFFAPPPNIINSISLNLHHKNTKNMVYIPWKTKIPPDLPGKISGSTQEDAPYLTAISPFNKAISLFKMIWFLNPAYYFHPIPRSEGRVPEVAL